MTEPTEAAVRTLLAICTDESTEDYIELDPEEIQTLAESWLRQRERIAQLEAEVAHLECLRSPIYHCLPDGSIHRDIEYHCSAPPGQCVSMISVTTAGSCSSCARCGWSFNIPIGTRGDQPSGIDATMRRLDAEVARCFGQGER